MTDGLEVLAANISRVVDRAASTWLQERGIRGVDAARLEAEIRRQIERVLPAANAGYQQAWNRGLCDMARRDFTAAMSLAGIAAAKECVDG